MHSSFRFGDRLIAGAQVAGVLATGWFVWVSAVVPRLGWQSLSSLVAEAVFCTVLAWMCGAAITFCIYVVVALADLSDVMRFSLRSSAPAMWFAPAIVLLSQPIPTAFVVSLVLIANATRQLVSRWAAVESPIGLPQLEPAKPGLMFLPAGPDTAFCSWDSAPVLMGSLTAQASVIALVWHDRFLGAVFLAASAAILTSLSIVRGAYQSGKLPALPPSILSLVLTFLMAATLSFGGMQIRRSGWTDSDSSADSGSQSAEPLFTKVAPPPDSSVEIGGGFPGVILLPEAKPHTMLLAPVPAPHIKSGLALVSPTSIPFSGEYWMYKPPATHPPPQSVVRAGKPSELSFHTTDGAAMAMEAYQRLTRPVDLKCCSQMQLVIATTDRYPGTISLELTLLDTSAQRSKSVSLGSVPVESNSSSEQTLSFPMPPATVLGQFDAMKVVFHRAVLRIDRSARVAIERFVFVP